MRHTIKSGIRATSLAAAIVASLTGVSAHAANTAQMQAVKLYGDVTIAQDSVQSWGPWEQFEAPAAGNQLPLPTFGSDASNLYRPLPPVTPPTNPVVSEGSLEGFATFTQYRFYGETSIASEGSYYVGTDQATVLAKYSLTNDPEYGVPAYVSGELTPHTSLGTTSIPLTSTGQLDIKGYGYASADGQIAVLPISFEDIDSDVIKAWAFIVEYANGDTAPATARAAAANYALTPTAGVVGIRTSDAAMAELRSNNFSATYTGYTLISSSPTVLNAKFGPGTFTATVNVKSAGTYGFIGNISGSNFNSTRVLAPAGTTFTQLAATSGMSGFFTGSNAQGAIGNVNVQTTSGITVIKDSFIAQQRPAVEK